MLCTVHNDLVHGEQLLAMQRETSMLTYARSLAPWIRCAASAGYRQLQKKAPTITAWYQSESLRQWVSETVGIELQRKHVDDQHACAIYRYHRAGDWMAFHRDDCGCDDESYTLLVGLEDTGNQHLGVDVPDERGNTERHYIKTAAGVSVLFAGSKVRHGVTKLTHGSRTIVSASFATAKAMRPANRARENIKDALLYFGLPALWQSHT
jgi:hypothetical protein